MPAKPERVKWPSSIVVLAEESQWYSIGGTPMLSQMSVWLANLRDIVLVRIFALAATLWLALSPSDAARLSQRRADRGAYRNVPSVGDRWPVVVEDPDHYIECHNGVVVSVSGPASDIGRDILKRGGNAVDAAIATAFALQVSYPLAGNIAGGGFMVIHPAPGQGDPTTIDYRECAPAIATRTMYSKEESQFSQRAVAVPGTIRGLELGHRAASERFPGPQLIQPAIVIARDGYIVDAGVAKSTNETLAAAPDFAELQRVYGKPGGGPWKAGDRMVQPDLARTLQLLADLGPNAFYTGPIAEGFLAEIKRGGGFITADDLANYRAIERKPLTTRYRGYDVYVPPPPSSGGICLVEELNMMENFRLEVFRSMVGKNPALDGRSHAPGPLRPRPICR